MSMINIDGALIQAYIDLGLGLDTAYEGEHFTPPRDGSAWARVSIVPADSSPATLGVNGEDFHTGFMQVDFYRKGGAGRATLIGYAQSMRDEFVAGKGYTRSGQSVRIASCQRSQIQQVDGYLRLTVTVFYEAATIRPEI